MAAVLGALAMASRNRQRNLAPKAQPPPRRRRVSDAVLAATITAVASVVVTLISTGYFQLGENRPSASPTSVNTPANAVPSPRHHAPAPAPEQSTATPQNRSTTYLTDLIPTEEEDTFSNVAKWVNGPVRIAGRNYEHGMKTTGQAADCAFTRTYSLSRDYDRFRTTIEFSDDTKGRSHVKVDILVDGNVASTITLPLKQPRVINLDVRTAFRLRLRVGMGPCSDVSVALGDPRLER